MGLWLSAELSKRRGSVETVRVVSQIPALSMHGSLIQRVRILQIGGTLT